MRYQFCRLDGDTSNKARQAIGMRPWLSSLNVQPEAKK